MPSPRRQFVSIHLHYLNTSPRDAAATLGLSRSGFYKLLARARDHLAVLMQQVEMT